MTDVIASDLGLKRLEAETVKINGRDDLGEDALREVYDSISHVVKGWCDELKRLIGFYQSSSSSTSHADALFLSGGGTLLEGITGIFHNELGIDVEHHDPFRKVQVDPNSFQKEYVKSVAPQFVVPFGLALRSLS